MTMYSRKAVISRLEYQLFAERCPLLSCLTCVTVNRPFLDTLEWINNAKRSNDHPVSSLSKAPEVSPDQLSWCFFTKQVGITLCEMWWQKEESISRLWLKQSRFIHSSNILYGQRVVIPKIEDDLPEETVENSYIIDHNRTFIQKTPKYTAKNQVNEYPTRISPEVPSHNSR